jgi:hypothetical protein
MGSIPWMFLIFLIPFIWLREKLRGERKPKEGQR